MDNKKLSIEYLTIINRRIKNARLYYLPQTIST